jgi:hypothetical protein
MLKWRFLDICSSCATSPGRPFSRWPNPQARENAALLNSWEILTSASASMSATIDSDQSIFAADLPRLAQIKRKECRKVSEPTGPIDCGLEVFCEQTSSSLLLAVAFR